MTNMIVYSLSHPVTGEVRYIGKSENGLRRPAAHGHLSHLKSKGHLPSVRWINKLRAQGLNYVIQVVEEYPDRASLMAGERFHIARLRAKNPGRLLNICDGGEGRTGPMSKEAKAKMIATRSTPEYRLASSVRQKNLWQTPAYVQKIKEGHDKNRNNPDYQAPWLGRKHSPETIKKMTGKLLPKTAAQLESIKKVAARNIGRKHPPRPPEWSAKLGYWKGKVGSRKGWVPTAEERQSLAQRSQKMWDDPEQYRKMLLIRRSQTTEAVKEKISNSLRQHYADPASREKMVLARGGRPIVDQHGNKYLSAGVAARTLGLHRSQVNKVLKGQRNHTGGYVFKYVE